MKPRVLSIALLSALLCGPAAYQTHAQEPATGWNSAKPDGQSNGQITLTDLLAQRSANRRARLFFLAPGAIPDTNKSKMNFAPTAAGPSLTVVGGGTLGRLTKWTGFTSGNSVIGDSSIHEDKFGNVGIGTDTPTSRLTVAGTIEASGGASVLHDMTLTGNGTTGSPLGVAVPLVLTGAGGTNGIIRAVNTTAEGTGLNATGGNSERSSGGSGVVALGGIGTAADASGGTGVDARGGDGDHFGGPGVDAFGGRGGNRNGGDGVIAAGGTGNGAGSSGGIGIRVFGGLGVNGASNGIAGLFSGNVQVTGTLSKGGGAFKIDHPLDPENKYLYHSFVESPDMKNIYDGNVTTDANGDAVVTLPDYFDALNRDFRYQLTVIGTFAQAIVAEEVTANRFAIKTSAPNVRVSWQVTGIRHDAFANKNRIQVEEDKPEVERGYYLHPEAFGQPEEKSINWARDPEVMVQVKKRRIEAAKMQNQQPNHR